MPDHHHSLRRVWRTVLATAPLLPVLVAASVAPLVPTVSFAQTRASAAVRGRTIPEQRPEQRTARAFEAARSSPLNLRAFLARMPKGADLHNHLAGAVYAESWIRAG